MENNILNIIEKIDSLKNQIDLLRPLSSELEKRIMQKFRLDWNYHSNNMEGNQLTYEETKDWLNEGITAKGKSVRDHFEMKGHNEAVEWIYDVVKDKNSSLTENFIRELHSLIIAPNSFSDAKTPEGNWIKKQILRGEYKRKPNHVLTKSGRMFYFASPEETPAEMNSLINWLRRKLENKKMHPIVIASSFHYKFVRIHPFDDGNGRISRILMNFILMLYNFPPVIVPTENRVDYINALELADYDNMNPFISYIGEQLLASLELVFKVTKGAAIDV